MLEFCEKCNSKLIKMKIGKKCPKCDRLSLRQINEKPKETIVEKHVKGQEFPFEKNQYYQAKIVRETFGCSMMTGINYNKEGYFLIIFMNAHAPNTHQNNPYQDYFDEKTGLYHYTGKGKEGHQTLTGVNKILEKSNEKNTEIHFFRQSNINSNHQYIGKVKLEKIITNIQLDKNSKNRKVYEFLLRPVK